MQVKHGRRRNEMTEKVKKQTANQIAADLVVRGCTAYTTGAHIQPKMIEGQIVWVVTNFEDDTYFDGEYLDPDSEKLVNAIQREFTAQAVANSDLTASRFVDTLSDRAKHTKFYFSLNFSITIPTPPDPDYVPYDLAKEKAEEIIEQINNGELSIPACFEHWDTEDVEGEEQEEGETK